ncbi:glycosyltransferase family 2 protein [Brachybacterium paraconglomeratum]|uniref:glycosyltransferase family 2 protein n=1 Tax=Brachybacterium paraconglomeratum TaxID=173362 RepID=UPI0022DFA5A8|nr:glycosyltransferase family 2 protein [Brachybacterium paraconglomeratum]
MTIIHAPASFAVSVVIPTLNASRTIAAQLDALSRQVEAPDFEVVIADNGSSDATLSTASAFEDRISLRIVDASGTKGASYARNVGARNSTAPVLAFLDADDVAAPGWLGAMHEAATSYPGALLFGQLDYKELNSERVLAAYRYSAPAPCSVSSSRPAVRDIDPFSVTLPGGNFAIPADVWRSLDGMRVDFPYGAEDAELGFRAAENGFRTFAVPGAVVHCRLRGEARSIFSQQRAWARARARLAASEPRERLGSPGVKSSFAVVAKSVATGIPRAIATRSVGALANDMGISVGRLEGALAAKAQRYRR